MHAQAAAFSSRRGFAVTKRGALLLRENAERSDASAVQVFGDQATWRQDGTLVLHIAGDASMLPGVLYSLSFDILNSIHTTAPRQLSISATGSAVIAPSPLILHDPSNASSNASTPDPATSTTTSDPQALGLSSIGQTSPYPLANNTITTTLVVGANLSGDDHCVLTLTGNPQSSTNLWRTPLSHYNRTQCTDGPRDFVV